MLAIPQPQIKTGDLRASESLLEHAAATHPYPDAYPDAHRASESLLEHAAATHPYPDAYPDAHRASESLLEHAAATHPYPSRPLVRTAGRQGWGGVGWPWGMEAPGGEISDFGFSAHD